MRTYDAIEKVSQAMIKDGFCEAILVKGSIGRGDDDEFSDVDLYAVIKKDCMEDFLEKRLSYLKQYLPIIFHEYVNFVAEQVVAIYEDGLHFDLYTVTQDTLPDYDKAKIIYDPSNLYGHYKGKIRETTAEDLKGYFNSALYDIVEADTAFCRKNYVWTARILGHSIAECAILLRYLYDKNYAYLGLKKINEILPKEQFDWLQEASDHLHREGFYKALENIMKMLDYVLSQLDSKIKEELNSKFLKWMKENLFETLFRKDEELERPIG